jgi:hypothetical protein
MPVPTTATKEEGEKICWPLPFFVATNMTKVKNCFLFEQVHKKFEPIHKNHSIFAQKIVTKLSKI